MVVSLIKDKQEEDDGEDDKHIYFRRIFVFVAG